MKKWIFVDNQSIFYVIAVTYYSKHYTGRISM